MIRESRRLRVAPAFLAKNGQRTAAQIARTRCPRSALPRNVAALTEANARRRRYRIAVMKPDGDIVVRE
jgi:hypothetical protein